MSVKTGGVLENELVRVAITEASQDGCSGQVVGYHTIDKEVSHAVA